MESKKRQPVPENEARAEEAKSTVFESGRESWIDGKPTEPAQLDPGAVHGPGGDSRPDLIDPESAEFRRADGDPALNTIREDLAPMPHAELHETVGRTDEELEKHVEKGGG